MIMLLLPLLGVDMEINPCPLSEAEVPNSDSSFSNTSIDNQLSQNLSILNLNVQIIF